MRHLRAASLKPLYQVALIDQAACDVGFSMWVSLTGLTTVSKHYTICSEVSLAASRLVSRASGVSSDGAKEISLDSFGNLPAASVDYAAFLIRQNQENFPKQYGVSFDSVLPRVFYDLSPMFKPLPSPVGFKAFALGYLLQEEHL